jgi:glycosyltransferase involved in cell wall biosynthesis
MIRICNSLSVAGYEVLLVGRTKSNSLPFKQQQFKQKRWFCFFQKGKLFYIEYNIRLFFYLLFASTDVYCAIDLDTILPNYWASMLRGKKRVYDAHELFCEMDEITSRPTIYKVWKAIERYCVPKFKDGYTIGECYAEEFEKMYHVQYEIVRNATVLQPLTLQENQDKYILYQGAVNEGRCFETLIPAMKDVNGILIVCGEGNFYNQAIQLVKEYKLEDKILFKGYIEPSLLKEYTRKAYVGITLFTNQGKSNYLSMANRFFDYMHYGVPQVCVNYPEYNKVNSIFEIAVLVDRLDSDSIARSINSLLESEALHRRLQQNCLTAREHYCWQEEEKKLIAFYKKLLG